MDIGKVNIGRRADKHNWKKYLLPHAYAGGRKSSYKHEYYAYYYRWLNIFWCKPRKCDECHDHMTSAGGHHIWDCNGRKIIMTVCDKCYRANPDKYREMSFSQK